MRKVVMIGLPLYSASVLLFGFYIDKYKSDSQTLQNLFVLLTFIPVFSFVTYFFIKISEGDGDYPN